MTYIGLTPYAGSGISGGARLKDTVNLFLSLDMNIDLLSYSLDSNNLKVEHINFNKNFKNIIINCPEKFPKFIKFLTIFPMIFYSLKSCKKSDIIFADLISLQTSIPAVLNKFIFKKILILDLMDSSSGNWIDVIHRFKYTEKADIIFVISNYLMDEVEKKYNYKYIMYFPIFIDTEVFKMNMEKRAIIRNDFGISEREFFIGYAGSFWNIEGIPILIDAFLRLLKEYPNIKLGIMGKSEERKDFDDIKSILQKLNNKKIILIPPKRREEVPDYLSAFDILCCPKIDCEINRAANPVKVVEYMSMGLPTVSSSIGEISKIIKNNQNGFLVAPGDPNDLKKRLEYIIKNYEKCLFIGYEGRKTIICDYSLGAVRKNVEMVIQRCFK